MARSIIFRLVTVIIILLWCIVRASGQAKNYIHYTTNDGLPTNELYNGVETADGYLLINSTVGLIRFDGYEFRQYGTKDGLPDIELIGSYRDVDGRVWIRPFKSRLCYFRNNRIYNEHNDTLVRQLLSRCNNRELMQYYQNEDGTLVITQLHNNSLLVIGPRDHYGCRLPMKPGAFIIPVFPVGDTVIAVTSEKTYQVLHGRVSILPNRENFANLIESMVTGDGTIYGLLHRADGSLYMAAYRFVNGSAQQLAVMDLRKYGAEFSFCSIHCFAHKLYLVNRNRVYEIDPALKTLTPLISLPETTVIGGLIVDRKKNFWLFTNNNGLFLVPYSSSPVYNHTSGLEEDNIRKLYIDADGTVYFGTTHFIYTLAPQTMIIRKYQINRTAGRQQLLKQILDDGAEIYFQYRPNKTFVFNKKQQRLYDYPDFPLQGDIKDMQVAQGRKFYAYANGAIMEAQGRITQLLTKRSTSICYDDRQNAVYIGTLNSILKYRLADSSLTDLSQYKGVPEERIIALREDYNHLLWAITADRGVYVLRNDTLLAHLDESTGLISNIVNTLYVTDQNELLFATNKGVTRFAYRLVRDSFQINAITSYTTEDGLPDVFVNDAGYREGLLYAATSKGISIINTAQPMHPQSAGVNITRVMINNMETSPDSLSALTYRQNSLTIKFSAMNFGSESGRYQYRLMPLKKDWQITAEHVKEFGPLNPNNYLFEVAAIDKRGHRISAVTRLPFTIKPAFWQTLLFKVLIILLLLTLIAAAARYYISVRQKEAMLYRTLAELRTKALKAQMNPHFIFNCLNTIQSFVNSGDNLQSNRFISRFSHLIRQTLYFSDESFIQLSQEISYLTNYITLEQVRYNHSFQFEITVAPLIDTDGITLPSMLIQPFVENAIRHGLRHLRVEGWLHIAFEQSGATLKVLIDDNGVGRMHHRNRQPADNEYASKGIRITEDRINTYAEILNKKISLEIVDKHHEDGSPSGTRVILKVPL